MQAHTTYQLRAYTTKNGYKCLNNTLEECVILYNAAWQERRDAWRTHKIRINYVSQRSQFAYVRATTPEWSALSTHIGRGVLQRVDRAFTSFFRRIKRGETPGYPRPKSKHRYHCIELAEVRPNMVNKSADGRHVYVRIKGLPTLKLRTKRQLPSASDCVGLRIVKRPVGWYVDLSYTVNKEPLEFNGECVGIDAGVNKRLTLSNGEIVPRRTMNRERDKNLKRRIDKANKDSYKQQQLKKTYARYKYREHVRNRNECHRWTTHIIRKFEFIGIEGIKWENLTKSPHGTLENPGVNVAQKSGLNRSILEQTLGLLRRQFTYKAEWADRILIEVDPAYTSQTCSRCKTRREGNWVHYRRFECARCGLVVDRDLNAAINILDRAIDIWGRSLAPAA